MKIAIDARWHQRGADAFVIAMQRKYGFEPLERSLGVRPLNDQTGRDPTGASTSVRKRMEQAISAPIVRSVEVEATQAPAATSPDIGGLLHETCEVGGVLTAGANRVTVFNRLAIQGVPTRLVLPARARGLDEFGVSTVSTSSPSFRLDAALPLLACSSIFAGSRARHQRRRRKNIVGTGCDFHSSQRRWR